MPLPTKKLGNLDVELPVLGFGGVIICAEEVRVSLARGALENLASAFSPSVVGSAQFGDAAYCREFVQNAVSRGATYIDVAPEYGDGVSQARLGPALEGARDKCFLACKTMFRDAEGAKKDLEISLAALKTDYLDLCLFRPRSPVSPPLGTQALRSERD